MSVVKSGRLGCGINAKRKGAIRFTGIKRINTFVVSSDYSKKANFFKLIKIHTDEGLKRSVVRALNNAFTELGDIELVENAVGASLSK